MPKIPTHFIIGVHLSDSEFNKLEEYCKENNGLSKSKAIRKLINEKYEEIKNQKA